MPVSAINVTAEQQSPLQLAQLCPLEGMFPHFQQKVATSFLSSFSLPTVVFTTKGSLHFIVLKYLSVMNEIRNIITLERIIKK